MTYVEAISEIQKRSVDALKVVQSTQIASLVATRDLTQALISRPLALLGVSPLMSAMTNLTRTLAFQLLDQQIACAKSVTETLIAPRRSLSPAANRPLAFAGAVPLEAVALEAVALEAVPLEAVPLEAAPLAAETPVLAAAVETIHDVRKVDEAIVAAADTLKRPDAAAQSSSEPDRIAEASLTSTLEAVAPQSLAAEPPETTPETVSEPLQTAASQFPAEPRPATIEPADETRATVALQDQVAEPPDAAIEPVDLEADWGAGTQTADVLAQTLLPPNVVVSPASNPPKAAAKKPKPPAASNNRARSKRRPGK